MDALATPDHLTFGLLIAAALVAGWIDAVTGGGGILQLPALLLGIPQASPTQALGTNKLSSIWGTGAATVTYLRRFRPDFRTAIPMAVAAFAGALGGAQLARSLPEEVFLPVIVIALIAVWIVTLIRPEMGLQQRLKYEGRRRHYVIAVLAGAGIGLYDGALGPGTGTFLIMALVGFLGYSFLAASVTAKIVNLGTNAAALLVFGLTGNVLWLLGFAMAIANITGAVVGARTALRRGSGFIRVVFLTVVGLLIVRLSWTVFFGG